MAIGQLLQKKPIQGTCGGIANYQKSSEGDATCAACGKDLSQVTPCSDESLGA